MRDFLDIDSDAARLMRDAMDPVAKAREVSRRELPKKFYQAAEARAVDGGHGVFLDGRPVKTPARRPLVLPDAALAADIANEWHIQSGVIDPGTMPATRLANSIIDGVADKMADVAADALKYAAGDLVCYRADSPDRLVERQTALWDPLLDWAEERLGARFLVAEGIIHVPQEAEAIAAVAARLGELDAWQLGGVHQMTTIGGSILAALAVLEGRLSADEAWNAVALDDLWSLEVWGADEEAEARLAVRRTDFGIAARMARAGQA